MLLQSPLCLPTATTESLLTATADSPAINIPETEMAECMKTSTIGQDRRIDTNEADHHANDTHPPMVNNKLGHLHCSTCASANTTFGKIGTGRLTVEMNSQLKVLQLARRES